MIKGISEAEMIAKQNPLTLPFFEWKKLFAIQYMSLILIKFPQTKKNRFVSLIA